MKKYHLIPIAGLALAATQLLSTAQNPPASVYVSGQKTPPRIERIERVEINTDEDDDAKPTGNHSRSSSSSSTSSSSSDIRRIITGGADTAERPLIIAPSGADEKSLASLDEDLAIMARILDKSIEAEPEDAEQKAMGIHLWALGRSQNRSPRNLYIEGHGAVFIRDVNLALVAPDAKPVPTEEKKEATSSAWDQARQEVYGRDDAGDRKSSRKKRAHNPYNADRVEALKKNLTDALKNAGHIRGLKESDSVTIVVQGSGETKSSGARLYAPRAGNEEIRLETFAFADANSSGNGPRSILTLRAKKSDIDAFAKDKIDADDFRKKVAVAVYQSPAVDNTGN